MSNSYTQIFKSTVLIGGTQVFNVLIGVIRTKVLAVLLGPSGVGLAGMFSTSSGLIGTLTGFGIGNAGVRQIAEAAGTGDQGRISRTVRVLRKTSIVSGVLGMMLMLIFSKAIGFATFGSDAYNTGLALMSLTLLFGSISAGQGALLQGMRRLRDLASCQIAGALFGTVASIILVFFLRDKGVAPFLVAIAAFGVLTSWWYARKIKVEPVRMKMSEMSSEVKGLLGMGMAFMSSGLLASAVAYITRVLMQRELGMDSVGFYTAAWTISSLYVGTILNAMGADFYPRLTAVAQDNAVVNRLVNEQTEMGLIIAVPGVLATLTLAPWVLKIFYSEAFMPAVEVIRWQIVGIALRIVSWPMGFIMLAKGMSKLFISTDIIYSVLNIGFLVGCMKIWGLEGAGIAFIFLYTATILIRLVICHRISRLKFSRGTVCLFFSACGLMFATLFIVRALPPAFGMAAGMALTAVSFVACLFMLDKYIDLFGLLKKRARTLLRTEDNACWK